MKDPGSLLGLDLGTVRIGVAKTDPLRILASPFTTIPAEPRSAALAALRKIIEEEAIVKIVVGDPRKLDGTASLTSQKVAEWTEWFKGQVGVPVVLWDERLTTAASQRMLVDRGMKRAARKGVVDQLAAVLILQGFLDAERIKSRP